MIFMSKVISKDKIYQNFVTEIVVLFFGISRKVPKTMDNKTIVD